MFGRKRDEQLSQLLESAREDRKVFAELTKVFAEQAEKDRQAILEQVATLGNVQPSAPQNTIEPDATAEALAEEVPKDTEEEVRKAAYALNLCTVSVSQIIDYNDLGIMEQEYDNILNNLNLQNFPKDEALLNILKQILDVISFFRIQDGEKKLLEEQYKKKVKDAIWSAVPSPSLILAGGRAGWAGLAISAITAVGTGYMNYRKERASVDYEKKQADWELQKSALEQFHALRRELFDTAWRLADAYNFKDSYRLTERQISQYNRILLEEDSHKRYERLKYVEKNFTAYPPFWYHFGHAAAEVSRDKDKYSEEMRNSFKGYALSAFDEFLRLTDEDRANSLLREDQLKAACSLEKFALISDDTNISQETKVELLQNAAKNSGNAFDTVQLCASSYLQIGETEKAIKLMRMLVNEDYNAEMNAQLLSMLYVFALHNGTRNCQSEYETLATRGYTEYMFPWPDGDAKVEPTKAFAKQQNEFLFNEYKRTAGAYMTQCKTKFDEIAQNSGDITNDLIEFVMGIEKDVQVLFGDDAIAQSVRDKIALKLTDCHDCFLDELKRKRSNLFSFKNICTEAFQMIAERIKEQVSNIRNSTDEKILGTISIYSSNLLLFKSQTKILGGTAINQIVVNREKSAFDTLKEKSQMNQADSRLVAVIKKYAKEGKIIKGDSNDVDFITENLSGAKHIRHKDRLNFNKSIAYLDTNNADLLFTTEGVYVYGKPFGITYASYKYGKFNLSESKVLQIGNKNFKHAKVDVKVLYEMIKELRSLSPRESESDGNFDELVGEFSDIIDYSNIQSSFQMKIDQIYDHTFGVTVEGLISQGTIKTDDKVTIVHSGNSIDAMVIQINENYHSTATAGDRAKLLLLNTNSERVHVGDYIIKE